MAQRFTKYTPLPDQAYDPRVTDLRRPLRVPGSGIGGPRSFDGAGYPVGGTTRGGGNLVSSAGDSVSAADVANAQTVKVLDNFKNRNRTYTIPIQLVLNIPTRVLPTNDRRTGLIFQNKDPAANLWFAFGKQVDFSDLFLPPGGIALFDFVTPRDDLWFLSTANIIAALAEMSRSTSG